MRGEEIPDAPIESQRKNERTALAETFEQEIAPGGGIDLRQRSLLAVFPYRAHSAGVSSGAVAQDGLMRPSELVGTPDVILVRKRHEIEALGGVLPDQKEEVLRG